MKLYVAGPMTGHHRWNFDAFEEATTRLRAAGYAVISPAETDLERGFDPDAPVEEFTPAQYREALERDVAAVFAVDGLALLPGWELSTGARAEVALATALSIPCRRVREWEALEHRPTPAAEEVRS